MNGKPLHLIEPATLRYKVKFYIIEYTTDPMIFFSFQLEEPLLLLGREKFMGVDIRVRVKGGGHVSQVYGTLPRNN